MSRSIPTHESFLTVSEVAHAAGVDTHVVRFYARSGLIRAARYAANGYRHFVPLDVKRVRFVRAAQALGFSLADIREVIRQGRHRRSPCPLVRDIIKRRLIENRARLQYVEALQRRMEHASHRWRHMTDEVPHGDAICALIESVAEEEVNGASIPGRRPFSKPGK